MLKRLIKPVKIQALIAMEIISSVPGGSSTLIKLDFARFQADLDVI